MNAIESMPDWVNEEPVFTMLHSAKHDFLYHPEFHPDRAGQVMMTGWRAIAKCELSGVSAVGECVLVASQEFVEKWAKEFCRLSCETQLAEKSGFSPAR